MVEGKCRIQQGRAQAGAGVSMRSRGAQTFGSARVPARFVIKLVAGV
jgi:hypothetical protein